MSPTSSSATRSLWRWQQRAAPYLFVLPFVVLFAVFLAYPLVRSFSLSFEKSAGPRLWRYVGVGNYRFLLHDPLFWLACLNTAIYAVLLLVMELPLSLGLAILLNSKRVRGRAIFRFAFFAPFLVGQVFLAMLATLMLAPRQGLVNQFISLVIPRVGNEINWRGNFLLAMPAVVLASLWVSIGFAMILWLAALQAVDPQLYEAAAVDGAGPWRRFLHITLPGIRPMFVFLLIVGTISALSLFELPWVFFGGPGPGFAGMTVVMYLYLFGFQVGDLGTASAVGWVLAGLIFIITIVQIKLTGAAREAGMNRRAATNAGATLLLHLLLAGLAAAAVVPFCWLVCASFKSGKDIFAVPFLPWHRLTSLTLDNFRLLLRTQPVWRWMANSLFITSTYTVMVVLLSSMGGFALAKYRFAGKRPLMLLMLATMLVPGQVLLPGNYEVMMRLGWINSWSALIIPGAVSVFGIFLFRQAMLGVPDELLDAGRIDGCSEFRLWWTIALPITRPAIGAFTLLSFLAAWNSYLWPQIILQDRMRYTLPVGLAGLMGLGQYESQYGVLMAGTLLAMIPAAILFFILQRQLVSGLTLGALGGN